LFSLFIKNYIKTQTDTTIILDHVHNIKGNKLMNENI